MDNAHSQRVARSLLRIDGSGSFSASHREPALGLSIEVDDVGRCAFPLTQERLEQLVKRAEPSPFGHKDKTLHDTSVRDSWEIPASALHMDPNVWGARFGRGLAEVKEALGFPLDAEVTAELSKLVIYREGQFFAPHRDTEKTPAMRATLVLVLPSTYRGGEIVISHANEQVTYDTADDGGRNHVSFIGFYADCLHEVLAVEAGYRVALTFALNVESNEATSADGDGLGDLKHSVTAFFDEPRGTEPSPDWMVCLLDHQYSLQSLNWARLKNSDRARAEALRTAADELGYNCFLALADVRECYETSEEGGSAGTVPPGGYGRLLDLEVSLEHWIDGRSQRCAGSARCGSADCTVSTIDSHQRAAYHLSHEPWTGNEGGTADVWYHQTALVLVPNTSELDREITRRAE